MKRVLFFATVALVFFTSNGCSSGSGEEIIVNQIVFFVDGFKKDLRSVTIDQTDPSVLKVRGYIGSEVIEAFEFDVTRNATGTSAINNMVFTQNNTQFYAFQGGGVFKNVTRNDSERVVKGEFGGSFRTLSGTSKIITDGRFSFRY